MGLEGCNVDFVKMANKCLPKSQDMKKFIKRIKGYFSKNSPEFLNRHNNIAGYKIGEIHKIPEEKIFSPLLLTVKEICGDEEFCRDNKKLLHQYIKNKCEMRKAQFLKACSEREETFNNLVSKELVNLIKRSTAIEYIKKFGANVSCVDRFYHEHVVSKSLGLESRLFEDDPSIRTVMRSVVKLGIPYLQGRLFVIGSLKEFDELGVGNELFEEIKIAEKKVTLPEVKVVKKL